MLRRFLLKGWAWFMYEHEEHLVSAGDGEHQRPGITHYLCDFSPDPEYWKMVTPAEFRMVAVEGPPAVPPPTRWGETA